jgi:hypothetical protein
VFALVVLKYRATALDQSLLVMTACRLSSLAQRLFVDPGDDAFRVTPASLAAMSRLHDQRLPGRHCELDS